MPVLPWIGRKAIELLEQMSTPGVVVTYHDAQGTGHKPTFEIQFSQRGFDVHLYIDREGNGIIRIDILQEWVPPLQHWHGLEAIGLVYNFAQVMAILSGEVHEPRVTAVTRNVTGHAVEYKLIERASLKAVAFITLDEVQQAITSIELAD